MSDFEKALSDESHKHENTLDVIGWDPDVVYGAKNGFELGARWAREFTVEEIIGYMKTNGYFNLADAIQYNFKDRGGE